MNFNAQTALVLGFSVRRILILQMIRGEPQHTSLLASRLGESRQLVNADVRWLARGGMVKTDRKRVGLPTRAHHVTAKGLETLATLQKKDSLLLYGRKKALHDKGKRQAAAQQ